MGNDIERGEPNMTCVYCDEVVYPHALCPGPDFYDVFEARWQEEMSSLDDGTTFADETDATDGTPSSTDASRPPEHSRRTSDDHTS